MRFRLRYLQHDLELTEGQFAVGRNASCQLSLDDPLVSRRHALLTVTQDGVSIEDLQSRNGVIVNGRKIGGRVQLAAGDRILIGAQELTLLQGRDAGRETQTAGVGKRTLPKMPVQPDRGSGFPVDSAQPSSDEPEPSMIRRADAFNLLGSVAEKALAMGRADEAERLLSPALVDMAARFSAKLASSTAKGAWADYVIELYSAQGRPCPAPVIDELYNAFRKVNSIDLVRLRAYIAIMRDKLASYGPA